MMRRRMFLLACAGLLLGCSSKAPPITSKELNVYSFSEYIPADLLSGFEKSSGIHVNAETYASNEQMLAGLTANPGKYDLILPSDYMVETLIEERSALLPLDLVLLPSYANIEQRFLSPYFDPMPGQSRRPGATQQSKHKFSLPYQWGTVGLLYDPAKVRPAPARWADLWRPELAGHIVILDDSREMLGMSLQALGYDKNTTNPARIAEARDKLKELAKGIVAFDSAVPEKYLLDGSAWIGVVYNGNAARAVRQNPSLVYAFPEEGAGIWFDNLAIPEGAKHADAAHAFIQYVLQPENSILITKSYPYSNPNSAALEWLQKNDASAYAAYSDSSITNPSPDVLAGAQMVKRLRPEATALYEQAWTEVKNAGQQRSP